MKKLYVFDIESASFRKATRTVGSIVWAIVKWSIATVSLAVFSYLAISFFVSTKAERELRFENRMYEKLYPELKRRTELLGDVVMDLKARDNDIYEAVFHTAAPKISSNVLADFLAGSDTITDAKILGYTAAKADALTDVSAQVDENFREVFDILVNGDKPLPPLGCPVDGFTYSHAGASTGPKINPFYKVLTQHTGFDLLTGQGSSVYATSSGTVISVVRTKRGNGNTVEIDCGGGYVTVYSHLDKISVGKGQTVSAGKEIGTVGMTGNSFAPHLHYEVRRDSVVLDPTDYLFGFLTPDQYLAVSYVAGNTGQSLD